MMRSALRRAALSVVLALVGFSQFVPAPSAQTIDCSQPPSPDPRKTFFQNFLNSCYVINLPASGPSGGSMSDPDQLYRGFFYRTNPNYELVLLGEFPRARTLSITIDDSHFANQEWFTDARLKPFLPLYVNPFLPGVAYSEDQLYAVTIQFGGTQPDPQSIAPGCGLGGVDLHANVLDATKRHAGMSWNGDPRMPSVFPPHDDLGPNTGGLVTIRQYLAQEDLGRVRLAVPVVLVRDLRTGCAIPARSAIATDVQPVTPDQVITWTEAIAATWIDIAQVKSHEYYRSLLPALCYQYSVSPVLWFRTAEYVPLPNPDAAYIIGRIPPAYVAGLVANKGFMRIRMKLPTTPAIPCDGCTLSGTEQLRYLNLSFFDSQKNTIASLGDPEMVRDSQGYATIIVGFGAPPPPTVTAANYYTYVDLSAVGGYETLTMLGIRTILPAPDFQCSAAAVASRTGEDNSVGGAMGEYAPVVDFLQGSAIPPVAAPLNHPQSCGLVPPEPAVACRF